MSKNLNSGGSTSSRSKSRQHIFHTEETDSNSHRKRSERQASQGVKVLVNREKGIDKNSDIPTHAHEKKKGGNTAGAGSSNSSNANTNANGDNTNQNITNSNITNSSINNMVPMGHPHLMTPMSMPLPISHGSHGNPHGNPHGNQAQSQQNGQILNSLHSVNVIASNQPHNSHNMHNAYNSYNSHNPHNSHNSHHSHHTKSSRKDDKILNRINFEKILHDKLHKEGLDVKNTNEITNTMNIGLESYIKNVIEKLIEISRARNVNLNLYSKQSEKNPVFKIHTHNIATETPPNKDFSILFTKNVKNIMGMLEEYEELNLKKMRQEKVSMYKSKLEEISQQKERDREELTMNMNVNMNLNMNMKSGANDKSTNANTADSKKVKPRVRKRDTMLKSVKNTLAKSQKRDEMAKHKKETQNTLETFLDSRPRYSTLGGSMGPSNLHTNMHSNMSQSQAEMVSNVDQSHNMESYTKFSEISKSEVPVEANGNDINLTIFKYYQPNQNQKFTLPSNVKRRITLKDLISYLEGQRKTPLQNLILHKAVMKLNQSSH